MRKFTYIILVPTIAVLTVCTPQAFGVKYIVMVGNFFFSPPSVNANVGDTIRWNWAGGFHTTTAVASGIPAGAATWNAPIQNSGQFFEYKIVVPGTYNYYCAIHGSATMSGTFTAASPPPLLTVSASAHPTTVVAGEPSQLDVTVSGGTGTYSYSWSSSPAGFTSPLQSPVASPTVTTTYSCMVTSGAQNVGSSVTVTVVPPPLLTLQNITVPGGQIKCYDASQTITVADGSPFVINNGGIVTLIAGQNIIFLPGTIAFEGSYMHGYITTDDVYCNSLPPAVITVEGIDPSLSAAELYCKVFPNPTPDRFTLEISNGLPFTSVGVTIFGTLGETVLVKKLETEGRHELSLSGVPAGVYFIRLTSGTVSRIVKIVKQP